MKNPKIKPRDYQKECLAAIDAAIVRGEKRALVVMASGLGKTYTSAFAVEKYLADKRFVRVLVLCHSEKILRQTKDKFKDYFGEEFSYGMYINDDKAIRPTNFLFATFQTMKDNRKDFLRDEFAYVIVDEAHHSHARTYFPTIRYFEPEFLLGLTATPDRLDGQKIEEIYGEPVYELGFVEATNRGLIAECDYRLILDDLSQERLDEYLESDEKLSITQLNRTLFIPKRDEEIIRLIGEYSADVENPRTMIFCRTIEHARKIAGLMGDKAVLVHRKNSDAMNDYALKAFKDGEINTIISVDMLNEGVDVPDANIIVFLRNTVSPAVFYQQLGRGTRLSEGKSKVKVLDFVKNCERIKMVLELKQEIDDFKVHDPVTEHIPHGAGKADSREKFTLNIATQFNIESVDIVSMLESICDRKSWTKEEVLEGLKKMRYEGQKITSATINKNPDLPHSTTIMEMFGGHLNNALREAGIEVNQRDRVFLSRDDMLVEGRAMNLRGEKITTKSIDRNPKLPHPTTIMKEFGSVYDFAILCGQEVKDLSKDAIVKAYWEESRKTGHWLSFKEIDQNKTLPCPQTYKRDFSTKETLVVYAQNAHGPIISEEELMKQLEREFQETKRQLALEFHKASSDAGHWLTKREFKSKNGVSSLSRYRKYFDGGVRAIIEYARRLYGDLDESMLEEQQTQYKTNDTLLREYWEASKTAGHWLSAEEVSQRTKLVSDGTYYHRFGGMKNTRQLAIEAYGDFTKEGSKTTN